MEKRVELRACAQADESGLENERRVCGQVGEIDALNLSVCLLRVQDDIFHAVPSRGGRTSGCRFPASAKRPRRHPLTALPVLVAVRRSRISPWNCSSSSTPISNLQTRLFPCPSLLPFTSFPFPPPMS